MNEDKFKNEVVTLEKFFVKYCQDKHINQCDKIYQLQYKLSDIQFNLCLCQKCHELIAYSLERLKECPHEEKPRCRNCPDPCYEKKQWKQLAKVMKYSSFKFGLGKIKNKIYNLLK